jgi:hypothetical protein
MKFNNVVISEATIAATRQWFADNAQACIDEVMSGDVKVNDVVSYVKWRKEQIADSLAGRSDHTFTFVQRAHTIQTGECIAFFNQRGEM